VNEANAQPAVVSGQASVIRKGQAIEAQPAVLRATIQITRAATGKVETYEIVGTSEPETKEA
jgi:hypothetical protein